MDIGVEISLYPLQREFAPLIREFLARLNADTGLRVVTNSMSTQVFGTYEAVMEATASGVRTPDLGGHASTTAFTDEVISSLEARALWARFGL